VQSNKAVAAEMHEMVGPPEGQVWCQGQAIRWGIWLPQRVSQQQQGSGWGQQQGHQLCHW